VGRGDLIEARAVGQLGVPHGQLDERPLVATLRNDQPDTAVSQRGEPRLDDVGLVEFEGR